MSSSTPELDRWLDVHTRASRAEHAVFMKTLGYSNAGTPPPHEEDVARAKQLRAEATRQFDLAMAELQRLLSANTLRAQVAGGRGDGRASPG